MWRWIFTIRKSKKGKATLVVEIRQGTRRHRFATRIRFEEKYWSKKYWRLKGEYAYLNETIAYLEQQLHKLQARNASLYEVKKLIQGEQPREEDYLTLLKFAQLVRDEKKDLVAYGTWRGYGRDLNKIKSFLKGRDIALSDVNDQFIRDLERFLIQHGYKRNSISNVLKFLRMVMYEAYRRGLIDRVPQIRVIWEESEREFLTIEEVKQLINYYKTTQSQTDKKHLRWILFDIATGLRFTDLAELRWKNIRGDKVVIKMHKTKRIVSIPLNDIARMVLPEPQDEEAKVFPQLTSNQVGNKALERICKSAGINKKVTIHALRHTFATLCLELGIPIEVVKQLLGHTKINVTMIYAHISDRRRHEEVQKFNQLLE